MVSHLERQFAVAAFDSWAGVYQALDALKGQGIELASATVLATPATGARGAAGDAETAAAPAFPEGLGVELCRLHFDQPLQCTIGPLASALGRRRDQGATTLADAVAPWLSPGLAEDLERQLAAGRILLWFEITEPHHHSIVCGELVRATPHILLLCDARF